MLHVGCFILLWCETLFVFVSPFCNEVVWSLKWTCLWLDVFAAIIWTLFRLFDDPSGSWRMCVWSGFCTSTCDCCWFPFLSLSLGKMYVYWYVDHEMFYHDTFSAYPVCVSVLHGYGQCWKILGLKLCQLRLILKCDCLRVQMDLEGCGWFVLSQDLFLLA